MDDAQERDWAERRENGWSSEDVFTNVRARAETWLSALGRIRPSPSPARSKTSGRSKPKPPQSVVDAEEEARAQLARMIEAEVVPRLMLAHRNAPDGVEAGEVAATAWRAPGASETGSEAPVEGVEELAGAVEALAQESFRSDAPALAAIVNKRRAAGLSPERSLLELIAPAARRVGEFWESDERDFLDVTIALTRLHAVAREVARDGLEAGVLEQERVDRPAMAVVASAPGEQHVLGTLMVSELLRRRGASVIEAYPTTVEDLRYAIRGRGVDMVCLSITRTPRNAEAVAALRRTVDVARAASSENAVIVVGGRAIEECPDLAAQIGAVACDAQSLGGFVEQCLGGTVGRC
ncbi:MAG: cobalamin B12-binding domain-containing protein [Rhodobacteraceae bacterium]|nr:cobalamin B12-binding domain-containing protein [Paracoccaceae bacterium]